MNADRRLVLAAIVGILAVTLVAVLGRDQRRPRSPLAPGAAGTSAELEGEPGPTDGMEVSLANGEDGARTAAGSSGEHDQARAGTRPDPQGPGGTIALRVLDHDGSAELVPSIALFVVGGSDPVDSLRVEGDSEGRFLIDVPAALAGREVRLVVTAPSRTAAQRSGSAPAPGRIHDWGALVLGRASSTRVRVLDPDGSAPVGGALVLALQDTAPGLEREVVVAAWRRCQRSADAAQGLGFEIGRSGHDGTLEFSTLHPGGLRLYARAEDFAPAATGELEGGREHELRMPAGGTVRVLVERSGGEPVPLAIVEVVALVADEWIQRLFPDGVSRSEHTGADGAVDFRKLLAGPQRFSAREGGSARVTQRIAISTEDGAPLALDLGADGVQECPASARLLTLADGAREELRFLLGRGYRLEGRVYRGDLPVAGALLRTSPIGAGESDRAPSPPQETSSAADGSFAFESLNPGRYALTTEHPWLALVHRQELVQPPAPQRVDVQLAANAVRGRVLGPDGQPLADAEVAALGAEHPAPVVTASVQASASSQGRVIRSLQRKRLAGRAMWTGADGSYELEGLPVGRELRIVVRHERWLDARSEPLSLGLLEQRELDFHLEPAGIVIARVVDAEGSALHGCLLRLRGGPDPSEFFQVTDTTGLARFPSLAPGSYELSCEWPWTGEPPPESPGETVLVEPGFASEVQIRW